MKLLVIILNYNVTDLTIDCLRSLGPEIPRVPGMKVAVLENGSGGDAEARLREAIAGNGWAPWVEFTAVTPNRGFTGGNNIIIREAMASGAPPDYFLLLNADTLIFPGAMESLVRFMDAHPGVGIAGSRLENPDGSVQGSPFRFPNFATEFDRGLRLGLVTKLLSRWVAHIPPPSAAVKVDWVSGASMIIRREVVEAIGGLDEGLFSYFDDVDYCLNARRAGWDTWFVPESRVMHIEGQSTGIDAPRIVKRRPDYWFQARRRFFLRNFGAAFTLWADATWLAGFALWRVRRAIQGKPDIDPPHMLRDAFRNSVFMTGLAVREVQNPAMEKSARG